MVGGVIFQFGQSIPNLRPVPSKSCSVAPSHPDRISKAWDQGGLELGEEGQKLTLKLPQSQSFRVPPDTCRSQMVYETR